MGRPTTHQRRGEEIHHSMCNRMDSSRPTNAEALGEPSQHDRQLGGGSRMGPRSRPIHLWRAALERKAQNMDGSYSWLFLIHGSSGYHWSAILDQHDFDFLLGEFGRLPGRARTNRDRKIFLTGFHKPRCELKSTFVSTAPASRPLHPLKDVAS